jgi:hypothetical protein
MSTDPDSFPPQKNRSHSAQAISRIMTRFPMIVGVLGELGKSPVPLPGDEEIRHGCTRAITAMLADLALVRPAPPGQPSHAELEVLGLLQKHAVTELINADHLERIDQLLHRILGPEAPHHH